MNTNEPSVNIFDCNSSNLCSYVEQYQQNQFVNTLREYGNPSNIKILSFLYVSPCFLFLIQKTEKRKSDPGPKTVLSAGFLIVPQGFMIVAAT